VAATPGAPEFRTSAAVLSDHSGFRRSSGEYLLVEPTTAEQVGDAVRTAKARGLAVRVRGNGHAFNGSNIPRAGELLLRTAGLDHYRFEEAGTITVGAGAAVWNVNALLEAVGYQLEVYNEDGPASTVGGYAAAGGIGLMSGERGGFWETVTRVELVTGEGEPITLRPGDEVFPWLFGAMGQLGIIAEMTLRILPQEGAAPEYPLGRTGRVAATPRIGPTALWYEAFVPQEALAEAKMAIRRIGLRYRHIWLRPYPTFVRPVRFRTFTPPLLSPHQGDLAVVGTFGDIPDEGFDWAQFRRLGEEITAWAGSDPRFRRYAPAEMLFEDFDFVAHYGAATFREFATLKRGYDPAGVLVPGALSDALRAR
jgi:FAD/FMN-containing dehydrogenase